MWASAPDDVGAAALRTLLPDSAGAAEADLDAAVSAGAAEADGTSRALLKAAPLARPGKDGRE